MGCLAFIVAILLIGFIANLVVLKEFWIILGFGILIIGIYLYSTKDEREAKKQKIARELEEKLIKEEIIKNNKIEKEKIYLEKMEVPEDANNLVIKRANNIIVKEKSIYKIWRNSDILCFAYYDYAFLENEINDSIPKIEIPINKITVFQIQGDMYTETNISGGEIKGGGSSLGGAIVGGVVAGGAGAVVGSRKKMESTPIETTNTVIDNRETILEFKNDEDKLSYIFLDSSAYKILLRLIPEKEINFNKHRVENDNINSNSNIYDEIKKLAELKDQSIITEDEFNEKKQELLKRI